MFTYVHRFGLSKDQGRFALPTFSTQGTRLALLQRAEDSECDNFPEGKTPDQCDGDSFNGKYRTADGSCNNLRHPKWGRANVALTRLLESDYQDGNSFSDSSRQLKYD